MDYLILDPQYLWLFGVLIGLGAFTQGFIGVPLGYWFILAFGSQPIFRLVFGATLALFALYELFRLRIRKELNKACRVLDSHYMLSFRTCRQPACVQSHVLKIVYNFILLAGMMNILKGMQ